MTEEICISQKYVKETESKELANPNFKLGIHINDQVYLVETLSPRFFIVGKGFVVMKRNEVGRKFGEMNRGN